jgi:hypothetical protein
MFRPKKAAPAKNFLDIPNNLLPHIMTQLDAKALSNMQPVSRQYKTASDNRKYWETLCLKRAKEHPKDKQLQRFAIFQKVKKIEASLKKIATEEKQQNPAPAKQDIEFKEKHAPVKFVVDKNKKRIQLLRKKRKILNKARKNNTLPPDDYTLAEIKALCFKQIANKDFLQQTASFICRQSKLVFAIAAFRYLQLATMTNLPSEQVMQNSLAYSVAFSGFDMLDRLFDYHHMSGKLNNLGFFTREALFKACDALKVVDNVVESASNTASSIWKRMRGHAS